MKDSAINWTDHTANFWWGCNKKSEGCQHCYAETLARERFHKRIWGAPNRSTREIKIAIWKDILRWDREAGRDGVRRRVFIESMGDFLEAHPALIKPRERAKTILYDLKNLDVLLLTKRPSNAFLFLDEWFAAWPEHVWFGVTVECQKWFHRVPIMLNMPARIHFVSVEPMLGPINMHFPDIPSNRDV